MIKITDKNSPSITLSFHMIFDTYTHAHCSPRLSLPSTSGQAWYRVNVSEVAPSTWHMVPYTRHLIPGKIYSGSAHLVLDLYDAVIVAGVHQRGRVGALPVCPSLHKYNLNIIK